MNRHIHIVRVTSPLFLSPQSEGRQLILSQFCIIKMKTLIGRGWRMFKSDAPTYSWAPIWTTISIHIRAVFSTFINVVRFTFVSWQFFFRPLYRPSRSFIFRFDYRFFRNFRILFIIISRIFILLLAYVSSTIFNNIR